MEPLTKVDYPPLFRVADIQSEAGRRTFRTLSGVELGLLVVGSAVGVVAALLSASWPTSAIVASVSFIGALVTRVTLRLRQDDQAWFDGRAVAESVKTQSWRYMMRAEPFSDDAVADRTFTSELRDILHARPSVRASLSPDDVLHGQITKRMRHERSRPFHERLNCYVHGRLVDQAQWYSGRESNHRSAAQRWSGGAGAAELAAVVVAVLSMIYQPLAEFGILGLLGTISASFTAWSMVGRHAEVSRAYGLATQELLAFISLAPDVSSEEQLQDLVNGGEAAISREHTMWIARRTESLGRLTSLRGERH